MSPTPSTNRPLADVALFLVTLDDAATGYAAIRRVPPGHKLICDERGLRVDRYWTLREPARPLRYRRPEEYAEHFRLLFDEAVADRLRTDRVGSQLSGGMDSSSVAVTAHRRLQATRSALRPAGVLHRVPHADPRRRGPSGRAGGRHSGFPVEVLNGETYLHAEPPAEPAWVPPEPGAATVWVMEEVCRRTAAFARVLLTGYGGDPLLAPPDAVLAPRLGRAAARALEVARCAGWRPAVESDGACAGRPTRSPPG